MSSSHMPSGLALGAPFSGLGKKQVNPNCLRSKGRPSLLQEIRWTPYSHGDSNVCRVFQCFPFLFIVFVWGVHANLQRSNVTPHEAEPWLEEMGECPLLVEIRLTFGKQHPQKGRMFSCGINIGYRPHNFRATPPV